MGWGPGEAGREGKSGRQLWAHGQGVGQRGGVLTDTLAGLQPPRLLQTSISRGVRPSAGAAFTDHSTWERRLFCNHPYVACLCLHSLSPGVSI